MIRADEETTMSQRILVVDDEAHILQVLSLKLRNAGYEVMTAVDGEEGFELATKHVPDLIITDFQMPYMTGLELCRELASNKSTSAIPVLMLTARGYALDPEDLSIGNIRDVLSKPFSPRAIVDQIQRILTPATGSKPQNRSEAA
jgi:two-component system alkaline phosphatase synthesis response regulator PhoP